MSERAAPLRVGVRVPHATFAGGAERLHATLATVEALGFDHVTLGDHVSFRGGRGYDGLVQAAAVVAASPRLPVHLAVYLLALRHPVLVARQLASLAELAPGRVVFGVGVGGDDRHEVEVCGVDPTVRGHRTDEALEIVRGLLAGEPVTFHGACFDVDDARILPAPSPPIPILVGGRSDAAVRRAARFADGWIGVWVTPERFAATAEAVEVGAAGFGRGATAWRHELLVWCGFGETRGAARASLAPAMEDLYRIPFERFERTSPYGTPADVAGALSAYVDAGAHTIDVIAVGADQQQALEAAAAARERLLA
ncbi:MAG TPA: LLM class flavin-dependent oxidoreductase [Acidimicrobiia bacterium]|nr:LLM class flavin-dependent oxidoreductase [Acidimicrobiia bacterium]